MNTTLRTLAATAAIGLACTMIGCESAQKTDSTTQPAMGMMNDTCPMMDMPVGSNPATVSYKGETIGFCCEGCVSAWNKLSDSQKAEKVAMMKK